MLFLLLPSCYNYNPYHIRCEVPHAKVLVDCMGYFSTDERGMLYAKCDNKGVVYLGQFAVCYRVPISDESNPNAKDN